MPDNNGGTGLDLLAKAPDDPLRPERVKELYALTENLSNQPKLNETS
jgi:hypothetical protein